MKRLSPSATAVLRAITAEPRLAEASNATLAARVNRCVRSVCRGLEELEAAGLVRLNYRRAVGPGDVARIIEVRYEPTAEVAVVDGGDAS